MIKFLRQLGQKIKRNLIGDKFLCDSCKYNWREVCTRPEKPNAANCQDYKPRR